MRRLIVLTVASWLLVAATASAQDGRMVIEQRTIPAGADQMFGYDGEAWGTGFFLRDGLSRGLDVAPGTYQLGQNENFDWPMTEVSCDDADSATPSSGEATVREITFNVDPGETVTCTATNTESPPADGAIEITAVAEGPAPSPRFGFTGDPPFGDFTLASGQGRSNAVAPGRYTIGTTGADGYDLTNLECDDTGGGTPSVIEWETAEVVVHVEEEEAVGCTFTFVKRSVIEIRAVTEPASSAPGFAFSSVTAAPGGFTLAGGEAVELDVPAGEHWIVEAAPPGGISLTGIACDDGDSRGELGDRTAVVLAEAGERVACTFTHALPRPKDDTSSGGTQAAAPGPALVAAPVACTSRRRFSILLPRGATLKSARVWVDGKRVAVRRRDGRLVATVDLRGKPEGRVPVRIRARDAAGRRLRQTRRFKTCG